MDLARQFSLGWRLEHRCHFLPEFFEDQHLNKNSIGLLRNFISSIVLAWLWCLFGLDRPGSLGIPKSWPCCGPSKVALVSDGNSQLTC